MDLPPLQTQLSGFQWLATQTCFFSIKPTLGNTTILLPQQTNESLTNALQQLYNLFVAPKQQQWEQYFQNPPQEYIQTIINLTNESKKHQPCVLLKIYYSLMRSLKPTPDEMILGKWTSQPEGEYHRHFYESVYHKTNLPIQYLLALTQIFLPAAIALLEGELALSTALSQGLHDKVNADVLQQLCPGRLETQATNTDTIQTLQAFCCGANNYLQSLATPEVYSSLLDPTLEDVI